MAKERIIMGVDMADPRDKDYSTICIIKVLDNGAMRIMDEKQVKDHKSFSKIAKEMEDLYNVTETMESKPCIRSPKFKHKKRSERYYRLLTGSYLKW